MAGITLPIIPMAHQYLLTGPIEGVEPGLPQLRDPDNLVYFREEVGGLCMGGYERNPMPWALDGIPADFNHRLLDPDWPRFEAIMAGAIRRVPADRRRPRDPDDQRAGGVHARQRVHPRRVATCAGLFVAAGFCAHGIAGAGGIGRQVASWIVDGEPELDLWKMDIRRFGRAVPEPRRTRSRGAYENYATYYDIHYPNEERQAGRPAARLAGLRAAGGARRVVRREVRLGAAELVRAERRRRGRGDGVDLEALRPRGWAGEHWSPAIGAEALATRTTAGLFDETSFAKIEVVGPGRGGAAAVAVRQRRRPAGRQRSRTPSC